MKNFYLFILSLFALYSSSVQAGECQTNVTNMRLNPLAIVFNGAEGGVDFGISKTVSMGVDLSYIHDLSALTGIKGTAKGAGLRLNHLPSGFYENSFISTVGLHVSRLDLKGDVNAKTDAISGDVSLGYRWYWPDSGFNTSLTAGLAQVHVKNRDLVNETAKGVTPTAELSFGYQL